jgi:hypothetical protein
MGAAQAGPLSFVQFRRITRPDEAESNTFNGTVSGIRALSGQRRWHQGKALSFIQAPLDKMRRRAESMLDKHAPFSEKPGLHRGRVSLLELHPLD